MDTLLYHLLSIAYLALGIRGVHLANRFGWLTIANMLLLVIAALLYDNAILAWGKHIGEGNMLEGLNQARYWLHALITPLLVLFAWHTSVRANIHGFSQKALKWMAILLTISLIVIELVLEVRGLSLEPTWKHGVLSYKKTNDSGAPPIMIIGVSGVLLLTSIMVWRRQKWPWYFAGVLAMGIVPLLRFFIHSEALHQISELLLMFALLATKAYQDKHPDLNQTRKSVR